MTDTIVFTIIGKDRAGIVEQISRVVNEHDANWLGSRMSQLGGMFAGMIQVEGGTVQLAQLTEALKKLSGLNVAVEAGQESAVKVANLITVTMLGLDRPGIVREVSTALAQQSLNVLDLQTDISQAAMTGGLMFNGRAQVDCGSSYDPIELESNLDRISTELGVDIEILEDD